MNYYERHLGDYAKDTGHLTILEHGAYTLLLDRYYSTEQGIPKDQAYRLTRARSKEERDAVDTVLNEFFTLNNDVWMKARVEEEIAKAQKKINAARDNGTKGGRPKQKPIDNPGHNLKETQQEPTGLFVGSKTETQSKALQTPDSRLQAPDTRSKNQELSSTASPEKPLIETVFDHWRHEWNHLDAKLDPKRIARIRSRLKNFTPQQLCNAISGFKHSDWHTGRDPSGGGKIFDGIQTLLRDDEQVETGLRLFLHPPQAPPDKKFLSAVERVKLANGTEVKRDERVVSEQRSQQGIHNLDMLGGDVREPANSGVRRLGS